MSKVQIVRNVMLASIAFGAAASISAAAVNGVHVNQRVFNDFPTSTLVVGNSGGIPATVTVNETGYSNTSGTGANRHDALFSTDGGATAASFSINQGFFQSMVITLADGSNSPRKEAGFRINSPVAGDALFIINSDAGEIVAFGAGAPFFSFGNNGGGNGYTPGTPLYMAERYIPSLTPGAAGPAGQGSIQYWINRTAANGMGAGVQTSGPLAYGNLEGGPTNYQIGAYVQASINTSTNPLDSVSATFAQLQASVTPEPTSIATLALGGLLLRRRRI